MSLHLDIFFSEEETDAQAIQEQAWQEFTDDYYQQMDDDNGINNPLILIQS